MKLAEALQERAALDRDIYQLGERLERNVLIQEGEQPTEDPSELKRQLDACLNRLEYLIQRINLTNSSIKIEGKTLTELIARRDVLQKKLSHYKDIVEEASRGTPRARNTEIKILPIISVKEWQKEIDGMSKELRQLENKIQQMNWTADLIE